jgi:asparagine synthase (glutamine-hydrolysing)
MCGIAGLYADIPSDVLDRGIRRMTDSLTHRGPDDAGYHRDGRVALGHRRLSIIDLKMGHQPIFNEDRSLCIIFNGEIFNYKEIKVDLEAKGHRFSTQSDTETILHAYEEWGEGALHRLRGMFAFCIWDAKAETLFLARDRFGIKPLFYAFYDGKFVFASEMKAILSDPEFKRGVEPEALASYFLFSYIPAPLTIYPQIRKLLPGHCLTFKEGRLIEKQYWDLYFEPNRRKKEEVVIEEFIALLEESVRIRLMSEVPIGAFLSGGIDSSTVVAMMSRELLTPVKTFTIGFGGNVGSFDDERKYARLMAEQYRTDHTELEVYPDFDGLIEEIVSCFDEPFADDGVVPAYFVCKLAREKVTVALSGLGGDEAFGGYERHLGFNIGQYYQKLPGLFHRRIVKGIIERLPEYLSGGIRIDHLKRFVRSSLLGAAEQYLGFSTKISPQYFDCLFSRSGGVIRDAFEAAQVRFLRYFDAENASDPLDKAFYCDVKMYLPDDLLALTDRLSMHYGLEVRVPFLDHRLMEYCATIPSEMKMKWFRKKYLLKRAVETMLPQEVISHKKQGFVGPTERWLRTNLKHFTRERLSERMLCHHGLLNGALVSRVLDDHEEGRENNDSLIWSLLIFQVWHEQYLH